MVELVRDATLANPPPNHYPLDARVGDPYSMGLAQALAGAKFLVVHRRGLLRKLTSACPYGLQHAYGCARIPSVEADTEAKCPSLMWLDR